MLLKSLFKHWTYQVFAPGTVLREKYEAFKSLLANDKCAHELMAELEEIYHSQLKVDFKVIEDKYTAFAGCVANLIEDLLRVCPTRYFSLRDYHKKFDFYVRFMLAPPEYAFSPPFTTPLGNIQPQDQNRVGGKALNLAALATHFKLPIPDGFVVTTNAFYYFIEYNDLRNAIDEKLAQIDINATASLDATARELHRMIIEAEFPSDIEAAIRSALKDLKGDESREVRLAMRSSAVAEDTHSSFAGQYCTRLDVSEEDVLDAYKAVIASKYTANALYYRINYGLSDVETPMAVLAVKMIDAKASGVIYTEDLESPESSYLSIHSIWGLGELLVGGETSADVVRISKDSKPKIIEKAPGVKPQQMVVSKDSGTIIIPVNSGQIKRPSLGDAAALKLARWGIQIESFYKEPQDIEWCMDHKGRLFLLQSRPLSKGETSVNVPQDCNFEDIANPILVAGGEVAASGIGAGRVCIVHNEADLEDIPPGAVLVARNASTRYVKVMDRLNAVVTDTGSTAGHFSSVAREFGIPTLVNTGNATEKLIRGTEVTVDAIGKIVYEGIVPAMLESPCARINPLADSPFMRKLRYVIDFVSPLRLIDPQAASFTPEGCRSFHDIIRFAHEKAVGEMFQLGDRRLRKINGAKALQSKIPMLFYVLDVGGGLTSDAQTQKAVEMDDIASICLRAVLKGLGHPDIQWGDFTHFDWAEHDKIVMSGGIISPNAAMFASHAVVSDDYLNLNLRFGYHFVILDALCTDTMEDNYVLFRFSGGGADLDKRMLRADFLSQILQRLEFEVIRKSDLIDAKLEALDKPTMIDKLDMLGRLLGATRLMDMYLKDASMVDAYVEDFMNGRYHFATIEE